MLKCYFESILVGARSISSKIQNKNQTHVKFAHEKEVYLNRLCNSREVGTDFKKLRQFILIEEFKRCVCDDIKTYLDEQKVENLAQQLMLMTMR